MAITLVQHAAIATAVNSTTATLTISATAAGSIIVVPTGSTFSRTATGVTDDQGNTYTLATGSAALNITGRCDTWYCLNPTAGVTSITVTYSGVASGFMKCIWAFEVAGFVNPAIDQVAKLDSTSSGGSTTFTGPSITTTSPEGFATGVIMPTTSVTQNPKAGNAFTAGGDINTDNDAACSIIFSAAGTLTPVWLNAASGSFCAATVSFVEAPNGTNNNLTQEFVEVFEAGSPEIALTQEGVEVFYDNIPAVNLTQGAAETFYTQSPPLNLTQEAAEIFYQQQTTAATTQSYIEVWYVANTPTTPTQVEDGRWSLLRFDFKYRMEEKA